MAISSENLTFSFYVLDFIKRFMPKLDGKCFNFFTIIFIFVDDNFLKVHLIDRYFVKMALFANYSKEITNFPLFIEIIILIG